eukprot:216386_1
MLNTIFKANYEYLSNITESDIIKILPSSNKVVSSLTINGCKFENNYNIDTLIKSIDNNDITVEIFETDFGGSCTNNYCAIFIASNLHVDEFSLTQNNSVLFGYDNTNQTVVDAITLYLHNFDPKNVLNKIRFINFGIDNGTVTFKPCIVSNPQAYSPLFYTTSMSLNTTQKYQYGAQFYEGLFNCNLSTCYVICEATLSCFSSRFHITSSDLALINCFGELSCRSSHVNISSSSKASIICHNENSCKESIISIINVNEITVECLSASSCSQSTFYISNSTNTTIVCYDVNSCQDLNIHSDTNNISYIFYSYNDGITIHLPSHFNHDNLNCDPTNSYLTLNGEAAYLLTLKEHIIEQLFSSNPLPCDAITFEFEDEQTASCTMEYNYSRIDSIHYFKDFMTCFPLYTKDITNMVCTGTRAPTNSPTPSPTNDPTISPTNDPTVNPTTDPTINPTESPTRSSCNYNTEYGLDIAFLVDNSCGLNVEECSQQQEAIAELLSTIKSSNTPRFMYVTFA